MPNRLLLILNIILAIAIGYVATTRSISHGHERFEREAASPNPLLITDWANVQRFPGTDGTWAVWSGDAFDVYIMRMSLPIKQGSWSQEHWFDGHVIDAFLSPYGAERAYLEGLDAAFLPSWVNASELIGDDGLPDLPGDDQTYKIGWIGGFGWPLRCAISAWSVESRRHSPPRFLHQLGAPILPYPDRTWVHDGTYLSADHLMPTPTHILWPRFVLNIMILGAASFTVQYGLILGVLMIVRRVIAAEGKCPKCGYDLRNNPTPGCPECGWGRSEHRPDRKTDVG